MRQPHVQAFIDRVLPYARDAAQKIGIPVSVVLAQWATESAWGRNDAARRNNLGCISDKGGLRTYPDLAAFEADYVRVLSLGYYDEVRRTAAEGGDPHVVVAAIGRSPYAESRYQDRDHEPGGLLRQVIDDSRLTEYDVPGE